MTRTRKSKIAKKPIKVRKVSPLSPVKNRKSPKPAKKAARIHPIGFRSDIKINKQDPASVESKPVVSKSQETFKLFADAAFEGMIIHDKGVILEANDLAPQMFGYQPKEVIGMNMVEFVTAEYREFVKKGISLLGSRVYEFMGLRKDGTVFPAEARGRTCVYQNRTARVVAIRDITERKQADKALREAAELHQAFMQASPDAVIIVDLQGHILGFSQKSLQMFGYRGNEQLIGRSIYEFVAAQDLARVKERFPSMLAEGERQKIEYQLVRKNGQIFMGEVSASVLRDESGNPKNVIVIIRDITERNKAEQALKQSEERYRMLVENTSDGIWVMDMNLNFTYLSPSHITGYTPEEMLGMATDKVLTPESLQTALKVFQEEMAIEQLPHKDLNRKRVMELAVYHKNGSIIWTEVTASFLRDKNNEMIGIIGVSRDITERKKAEQALKESEERYRLFAENASDVLWTMDMNLHYTYSSTSRISGYTPEETLKLTLDKVLTPESLQTAIKAFQEEMAIEQLPNKDLNRKRTMELAEYRKDGSVVWTDATMSFMRDKNGKTIGIIGVSRDITERKKAQEALAKSEFQLRLLTDNMTDLIGQIDDHWRFLYASPSHTTVFGYDLKELIGKSVIDFVHPEDLEQFGNAVKDAFETKKPVKIESRFRHQDGHYLWLEIVGKFLSNEQGRTETGIYSARDISQRRAAEQALKESEERYRMFAENASDALWIMDMNLNFTYHSSGHIFGYTAEEMLKRPVDQRMTPESVQTAFKVFQEEMAKEQLPDKDLNRKRVVELEQYHKNGSIVSTESTVSFLRDKDNKPIGIIGVSRDITERRKAEQALRESEEKFRILVTSIKDLIFTLDRELRYTGIYGRDLDKHPELREVFIGKKVTEVFKDKTGLLKKTEERERCFEQALEGHNVVYEWSEDLAGESFYFQTRLSPLKNAQGEIVGVAGVALDVTERKKAEELLNLQHDLAVALSSASDLEYALKICLYAAIRVSGMDCGGIYLMDEKSGALNLRMDQGLSKEFVNSVSHFDADSPNTQLVIKGRPAYSQYLKMNLPMTGIHIKEGLKAIAVIPVQHEGAVIACIIVASHSREEISPDFRNALETIVMQIGSVIARLKAQDALASSEEKYRELVENAGSIILRMDPEGKVTFFNEFAQKFFGYSEKEILGRNVEGAIVPQTDSSGRDLAEMIRDIGRHPERYKSNENENMLRNGTRVQVAWTNVPLFDEQNQLSEILCVGNDITALVAAEQALRESEARLRMITDNMMDMIGQTDVKGRFQYVSPSNKTVLGYSSEEMIGKSIYEFMHPDDVERIKEEIIPFFKSRSARQLEFRYRHKQGHYLWLLANGQFIYDEKGKAVAGVYSMRDITERKVAEQKLQKEQAETLRLKIFLEDVMNHMMTGLMVTDLAGGIRVINERGREVLHLKENFEGKSVRELFPQIDLASPESGKQEESKESVIKLSDGRLIPLGYNVNALRDAHENEVGKIIVFRDLTEINEIREQLRAREKFATIGEIARGVAHEIKNPLFALSSGVQVLESELELNPEQKDTFRIIMEEIFRMNRMVKHLLSFTAKPDLVLSTQNPVNLINEVVSLNRGLLKSKDLQAKIDYEPDLPALNLDHDKMLQVLINVFSNAIDFSPAGGQISISCAVDPDRKKAIIRIRDQGPGIPEEIRGKIFDLFFTTKEGSTGIGLAVSKRIIMDHKGAIYLENQKQGTCMAIELPLEAENEHNSDRR